MPLERENARHGLRAAMVAGASGLVLLLAGGLAWRRAGSSSSQPQVDLDPTAAIGRGRPETPPSREAIRDGYEPHDARTRTIGIVMVVGVAIIAASIGGLFFLLHVLHAQDDAGPALTAQQRAVIQPPGPPLQASPQYDLASLRRQESDRLSQYAWADAGHTRARIPIARAMTLVTGTAMDKAP